LLLDVDEDELDAKDEVAVMRRSNPEISASIDIRLLRSISSMLVDDLFMLV